MSCNSCNFSAAVNTLTDEEAELHAKEVGVPPRPKETLNEIDERGAFIRQPNAFTKPFGDKPEDNHAENRRFAIYWAHGCHWSNRPVIVRDILGLQEVIGDVATTSTGVKIFTAMDLPISPSTEIPFAALIF